MNSNGDDPTRPNSLPTLTLLKGIAGRQDRQESEIRSLDAAVNLLLAKQQEMEERLTAILAAQRGDMRKGFERLGELIDRVNERHDRDHRRAEDSRHDLEDEVRNTRRLIMLKNVSWPTAVVAAALVVCCTVLIALGKPVPTWLVGLVGSGGVGAALLPGLLGAKQS